MSMPSYVKDTRDFMARLYHVLDSAELDCQCRTTLDGALSRFSTLECRRQLRKDLRLARRQRDQIVTLLYFLKELDEITDREIDQTVFEETASLFDEIGACATNAAKALRDVDAMLHSGAGGKSLWTEIQAS